MDQDEETLFADIAVEKGFASGDEIEDCRHARERMTEVGLRQRSLSGIMIEKGMLSREQARRIRREMARRGVHPRMGGYEVVAKIGEGGMGSVYRARQTSLGRTVALKVLSQSLVGDKTYLQRFFREARTAGNLNHPNIVQVFDFGKKGKHYFIAMEYVAGRTVDDVLGKDGRLDEAEALRILADAAAGLQYAHRHGVVHRDIKPANILLSKDGRAKLADLGIAKHKESGDQSLTKSGVAIGTPWYMSPEQAQHGKHADPRSDIYSLGATLYHMVTGLPPYDGETPYQIIIKHVTEPLPDPREHNPGLSDAVCGLIRKMMAKNPDERFQSAKEVLDVIARVRGQAPAAGLRGTRAGAGARTRGDPARARRNTTLLLFGALVILTGLGVVFIATWRSRIRKRFEAAQAAVNRDYLQGVALYEKGDYAAALRLFDKARSAAREIDSDKTASIREYFTMTLTKLAEESAPAVAPGAPDTGKAPPAGKPEEPAPAQPTEGRFSQLLARAQAVLEEGDSQEARRILGVLSNNRQRLTRKERDTLDRLRQRLPALPGPKPARRPRPGPQFRNSLGMTLVLVPRKSAKPLAGRRRGTRPFYICAHEVTVAQFVKFTQAARLRGIPGLGLSEKGREFNYELRRQLRAMPRSSRPGEENLPVTRVSAVLASGFCLWLSRQEDRIYHLPTVDQWEMACRAGTTTPFYWGNRPDKTRANFGAPLGRPRPVGSYAANPWGLRDTLGNVSEWCMKRKAPKPGSGTGLGRWEFFICGGAYDVAPKHLERATKPSATNAMTTSPKIGFRVAAETEQSLRRNGRGRLDSMFDQLVPQDDTKRKSRGR